MLQRRKRTTYRIAAWWVAPCLSLSSQVHAQEDSALQAVRATLLQIRAVIVKGELSNVVNDGLRGSRPVTPPSTAKSFADFAVTAYAPGFEYVRAYRFKSILPPPDKPVLPGFDNADAARQCAPIIKPDLEKQSYAVVLEPSSPIESFARFWDCLPQLTRIRPKTVRYDQFESSNALYRVAPSDYDSYGWMYQGLVYARLVDGVKIELTDHPHRSANEPLSGFRIPVESDISAIGARSKLASVLAVSDASYLVAFGHVVAWLGPRKGRSIDILIEDIERELQERCPPATKPPPR